MSGFVDRTLRCPHGGGEKEADLRDDRAASAGCGASGGFAVTGLCLATRLLSMERHELCLDRRYMGRTALRQRALGRRPLDQITPRLLLAAGSLGPLATSAAPPSVSSPHRISRLSC